MSALPSCTDVARKGVDEGDVVVVDVVPGDDDGDDDDDDDAFVVAITDDIISAVAADIDVVDIAVIISFKIY